MNDNLLKDFQNWFSAFSREHKNDWKVDETSVEIGNEINGLFRDTSELFKKLLKKTEKEIYSKIDKEIDNNKQDRATLTKAKRLSKSDDIESKYIDLRFIELWEEIAEEDFKPFLFQAMKRINNIQQKHIEFLKKHNPADQWKKDPRFSMSEKDYEKLRSKKDKK